jgi:hypothetical protein
MADRIAEQGALQDAISNNEINPPRLSLAGYIRGLFLDWSASPYNPLTRLTARGRYLGYFWDNGAIGLSMDFANQSFIVKDGTLQSKSFSDIVNFSRTSNATVTNSAGTIGYAPHNLLASSEQFNNASWTKSGLSITANSIVAPDGTTTADTLTSTTSTAGSTGVYQSATFTAGSTLTFYAKAGTANFIGATFGGVGCYANFNLGTGAVASSTGCTASIVLVGSGWYRCVIANSAINGTLPIITGKDADPSASPWTNGVWTSGNTVYLWGAQLELNSTATTYNPTTVKNLLGYSELFDNAAWTKSNSFVQTNLLTYSEAFDNAGWTKGNSSITANVVIAPNGALTSDKLVEDATTNAHYIEQNFTTIASQYTYSVYAKAAERNWLILQNGGTANAVASFNLSTGALGTVRAGCTAAIESVGNGWYRCSIISTGVAGTSNFRYYTALADNTTSYTGNGTSGIYIWGAQLVQGSVAGDYRRTDIAALPIYYPNHNGVVVAEKVVENTATNSHVISVGAATTTNTPYTLSIYAKAGERNWLAIGSVALGATGYSYFNLATGVKGTILPQHTATITSIGNGWYRCSITALATATSISAFIGPANSDGGVVYTGDGTSGIYIFGAQLSDSASLDPYVLTAAAAPTAAAYYGPRFDYDPVTLQPKGLLIEEQRSNLLLNSSLAGTNLATQSVTVTAVAHTLSFYGTGNIVLTGVASATLTGTGAYPTRSTLTFTPTAGSLTLTVTGTVQYAQLEIGSFATSFIPTAASQVTRVADVATIQGSNFYSWYNQNEGSVYVNAAELSTATSGNRKTLYTFTTGNFNNIIRNGIESGTLSGFNATYESATQASMTISAAYQANVFSKSSSAYKTNDFYLNVNNGTASVDTLGTTPMSFFMDIGYGPQVSSGTANTSGDFLNGHIKSISYYPVRLSNDVLKGLTA